MMSNANFELYKIEQQTLHVLLIEATRVAVAARDFEKVTNMLALASSISLAVLQSHDYREKLAAGSESPDEPDDEPDMSDDAVDDLTA